MMRFEMNWQGNFGRDKEGQQLHHTQGVKTESAEAGSRHVGGRKLRNVDKRMKCPTILVREEVVGKDMSVYGSSSRRTEQSHRKRVGEIGVHISEPSPLKRVRKLRRVGETVDINDNELERARPRHLLESTADYNQGTNTAGCLSQEGRHQTDARIFIDLSDDVDNRQDAGLIGLQAVSSKGKSCETTEDADGKRMKGRCSQSSQASQSEKEIACAICLVDAKCPIEGLLECGHVFCFKCIFKWIVQPVLVTFWICVDSCCVLGAVQCSYIFSF
jgi:hypothetical protein